MAAKKKTTETGVAEIELQETGMVEFVDYGDDFGDGADIDSSETSIPYLKILQAQSPEIHPEILIEGGAPGRILNTASRELIDSVHFIPALRLRKFAVWSKVPEGEKAALLGKLEPSHPAVVEALATQEFPNFTVPKGFDLPEGSVLTETFYLFGIIADEDATPAGMACITFSSTQIKHWKKGIKHRMDACKVPAGGGMKKSPPIYSNQLLLTTGPESKGENHWKGWVPKFFVNDNVKESILEPSSPLYQAAKDLREAVLSGAAKVDESQEEGGKSSSQGTKADPKSPF